MVEYKTMRVREDAWKAANKALGDNETWSDYLLRCAEEPRVEMSEDELRDLVQNEIREMVDDDAL